MPDDPRIDEHAAGDARRARLIQWTAVALGAFAIAVTLVLQLAGLTESRRLAGTLALLAGAAAAPTMGPAIHRATTG